MGAIKPGDMLEPIGAVETALKACGHSFETGIGLTAAQKLLSEG